MSTAPDHGRVVKISIRAGRLIDSVSFHYQDGHISKHGGDGGDAQPSFELDADEYISEVHQRSGDSLDAIWFVTSAKRTSRTYGNSYGGVSRQPFLASESAKKGQQQIYDLQRDSYHFCGKITGVVFKDASSSSSSSATSASAGEGHFDPFEALEKIKKQEQEEQQGAAAKKNNNNEQNEEEKEEEEYYGPADESESEDLVKFPRLRISFKIPPSFKIEEASVSEVAPGMTVVPLQAKSTSYQDPQAAPPGEIPLLIIQVVEPAFLPALKSSSLSEYVHQELAQAKEQMLMMTGGQSSPKLLLDAEIPVAERRERGIIFQRQAVTSLEHPMFDFTNNIYHVKLGGIIYSVQIMSNKSNNKKYLPEFQEFLKSFRVSKPDPASIYKSTFTIPLLRGGRCKGDTEGDDKNSTNNDNTKYVTVSASQFQIYVPELERNTTLQIQKAALCPSTYSKVESVPSSSSSSSSISFDSILASVVATTNNDPTSSAEHCLLLDSAPNDSALLELTKDGSSSTSEVEEEGESFKVTKYNIVVKKEGEEETPIIVVRVFKKSKNENDDNIWLVTIPFLRSTAEQKSSRYVNNSDEFFVKSLLIKKDNNNNNNEKKKKKKNASSATSASAASSSVVPPEISEVCSFAPVETLGLHKKNLTTTTTSSTIRYRDEERGFEMDLEKLAIVANIRTSTSVTILTSSYGSYPSGFDSLETVKSVSGSLLPALTIRSGSSKTDPDCRETLQGLAKEVEEAGKQAGAAFQQSCEIKNLPSSSSSSSGNKKPRQVLYVTNRNKVDPSQIPPDKKEYVKKHPELLEERLTVLFAFVEKVDGESEPARNLMMSFDLATARQKHYEDYMWKMVSSIDLIRDQNKCSKKGEEEEEQEQEEEEEQKEQQKEKEKEVSSSSGGGATEKEIELEQVVKALKQENESLRAALEKTEQICGKLEKRNEVLIKKLLDS